MTAKPLVFVDAETTGLGLDARPWEIALIRREPRKPLRTLLLHVDWSLWELPEGTEPAALQLSGWLERGVRGSDWLTQFGTDVETFKGSEQHVALAAHQFLVGQPILIGVGVHFDARMLTGLFTRHHLAPEPWHYGLLDLKAAAWGVTAWSGTGAEHLPMRSEQLADEANVMPPIPQDRHTALGDARWAVRWFDALTRGAR